MSTTLSLPHAVLRALAVLAVLATTACTDEPVVDEWRGLNATVDREATAVVRNEEDWVKLWALVSRLPDRPLADGEAAIAIFLGSRPTGGFRPQIVRILDEDERILVEWRELEPGPDEMAIQVLTSPWLIRTLAADDRPIRFREVRGPVL